MYSTHDFGFNTVLSIKGDVINNIKVVLNPKPKMLYIAIARTGKLEQMPVHTHA